jgi:hypothetical protein
MDDVKDSNSAPAVEQGQVPAMPATDGATPDLDGSVDALVANLRAAKEQFEALLRGTGKPVSEAAEVAKKRDRSAA